MFMAYATLSISWSVTEPCRRFAKEKVNAMDF
ncbi:MAG: hypothetical protein FD168_1207 [Desulfobulbaceae bacterium]|nr:MAG: hypothetical protein FD168_1207 [Desulfobulbaceae bacterium]